METLGLIGSGRIGGTVARLAVAAGYDVVLSNSRGPETLEELVDELGPRARTAHPAQAAEAGDLAVVSVPLRAYRSVPAEPPGGKVVIDTNNYYPDRDGTIAELDEKSTTSSELLQRHLATSRVVKGFNSIYFEHLRALARPPAAPYRSPATIPSPRRSLPPSSTQSATTPLTSGRLPRAGALSPALPCMGSSTWRRASVT